MSSTSKEFYFPEKDDKTSPQVYLFQKFTAYVGYLNTYYKEKINREIPVFRDFVVGFQVMALFGGDTAQQKREQVKKLYGWLKTNLAHLRNFDDCVKYSQQFLEHKAQEEKINITEVVEPHHLNSFAELLWANIEAERSIRKKK